MKFYFRILYLVLLVSSLAHADVKWSKSLADTLAKINLTYGLHLSNVYKQEEKNDSLYLKKHFLAYAKKFVSLNLLKTGDDLNPIFKAYYFAINIKRIKDFKRYNIDLIDFIKFRNFNYNNYQEAVLVSHLIFEATSTKYTIHSPQNSNIIYNKAVISLDKIYKGYFYKKNKTKQLTINCDFLSFNKNFLKISLSASALIEFAKKRIMPSIVEYEYVMSVNNREFSYIFEPSKRNLIFLQNSYEDRWDKTFFLPETEKSLYSKHVFVFSMKENKLILGSKEFFKEDVLATIKKIIKINDSDNFYMKSF